ncbi:DUF1444 family protein [Brevibacillus dissolubilis]|uniref:DUF1444 family protein n=1 Tax=Brevibacillus dissolubilis TaxID=1844116 RepID=UPI001115EC8D|nr:DUF1444 family protein [Brevibacillus dissolubilis]
MTDSRNREREAVQNELVERIKRDLPRGWSCQAEGEGIRLVRYQTKEEAGSGDAPAPKPFSQLLSLEKLQAQVEQKTELRQELVHSYAAHILGLVRGMNDTGDLTDQEHAVYPIARHKSIVANPLYAGAADLITAPHTAETVMVYALDREEGYKLISQSMLDAAGWTVEKLHECAIANVQKLPVPLKSEKVGENTVHFISPRDGYAASRIFVPGLLEQYNQSKSGKALGVAIPHQDVLVLVDIHNETGAQLLARLTFDFASKGSVPICPLPFLYQDGALETYFIMQQQAKG